MEISLLSRLEHKNIVSYYGTQRTETHINIFLEYVAGIHHSNPRRFLVVHAQEVW
jgi:serine/threonine protein kinase